MKIFFPCRLIYKDTNNTYRDIPKHMIYIIIHKNTIFLFGYTEILFHMANFKYFRLTLHNLLDYKSNFGTLIKHFPYNIRC